MNQLSAACDAGVFTTQLVAQDKHLGATIQRHDAIKEKREELKKQLTSFGSLAKTVWTPVEAAIKFESAMADVKAVVNFKSPDQFKAMQKDILRLSTEIPITADGLATIVAAADQAGVAGDELLRVTKDATKMGLAFDMSGKEAASAMSDLRSDFKLNQDQVVLLGDAYSHLSENLNVTEKDMLNFSTNIGDKASRFGLSGQQAGALGATFLALDVPLKDAENGINALFTKLMSVDNPGKKVAAVLKSMGMDAAGMKQAIEQDAQGALLNFLEAAKSSDDVTGTFSELLGDKNHSETMAKLVDGSDTYRQSLALVADPSAYDGSMEKKYEARSDTTGNNLIKFNNQVTRLGVTIGSVLLPPLNSLLAITNTVVGGIADLAEQFPLVTKVVVSLTYGLMALKGAALAAGYAWTFIQGGWSSAVKAIQTLKMGIALASIKLKLFNMTALVTNARIKALAIGGAIKGFAGTLVSLAGKAIPIVIGGLRALSVALLTNPVGLIIAGIALAAGLLFTYWEPIKGFFSDLWDGIKSTFTSAWNWLTNIFSLINPLDSIASVWTGISDFFTNLWSGIIDQAKAALDWLLGKFEAVAGFIGDVWSSVTGWFGDDDSKTPKKSSPRKPDLKPLAMATTVAAAPVAAQPADIAIPQLTTPQAMTLSVPQQAGQITHNNSYQISIHQQPDQNTESLVEQMMRELERRQQQRQRGVLGDGI
jgi:TP901 family phage tail tape measure protein